LQIRLVLGVVMVLLAALSGRPAHAQITDYDVKAAMLVNFGLYVEPFEKRSTDRAVFEICYAAPESFETALNKLKGSKVKGRVLAVRVVRAARDTEGCDILFISDLVKSGAQRLIDAAHEFGALTVQDGEREATLACISLGTETSRVVFNVNLDAVSAAGLVVSSRLLKLAKNVVGAR
jgi:hypothetical protein